MNLTPKLPKQPRILYVKLYFITYLVIMGKIRTGIGTLDVLIGGGLRAGAVAVVYGEEDACNRVLETVTANNTEALANGALECMTFSEDVPREVCHDIYIMATRYRKCVVVVCHMMGDVPTVVADMADTVIYAEKWRGTDTWAMVRKNRSNGIHDTWHQVP